MTHRQHRARRILLACALVVVAAAALAGTRLAAGGYTSRSAILLSPAAAAGAGDDEGGYVLARIPTLIALARSPEVAGPAARALDVGPGPLRDAISASARSDDSTVLDLEVTCASPAAARRAGDVVLSRFRTAVAAAEAVSGGTSRVRTTVVTPPTLPPSAPVRPLAILGLVVAALAALAAVPVAVRAWWAARPRAAGPAAPPSSSAGSSRFDPESGRYLRP